MQIADISAQAKLALAAYADYSSIAGVYQGRLADKGMGVDEAATFIVAYGGVPPIQFNDTTTGLSATLFEDASGKHIAIRGTDSGPDYLSNLLLLIGVPPSLDPQFRALKGWIDGLFGPAKDGAPAGQYCGDTFTVCGHSLGGYLAAAVQSSYGSSVVTGTYLYNAPGIGSIFGTAATFFQRAFNLAAPSDQNVWNIKSSEGPSVVSGLGFDVGTTVVQQAETTNSPTDGHRIDMLSEGLMVSDAYTKAIPSLTFEQAQTCIDAFGKTSATELEEASTFLYTALTGGEASAATNNRDALFSLTNAIKALPVSGVSYELLAGNVAQGLWNSAAAGGAAGTAARYALEKLSPIAVVGGVNPGAPAYADHSPDYWLARSMLLEHKMWFSTADKDSVTAAFPVPQGGVPLNIFQTESLYFEDRANNYTISQGPMLDMGSTQRIIFASNMDSVLQGGGVADKLFGGSGADNLSGGYGADLLDGGDGNDTYFVDNPGDVVTEGAGIDTGIDTVHLVATAAMASYLLPANVEKLIADPGAQVLGLWGNELDNEIHGNDSTSSIYGGAGNDTLWAGAVNTTLSGEADNDTLNGFTGNDTLDGGDGNDTLNGGTGNDTLNAGPGYDTILFARGDGNDTLTLGSGTDTLKLSAGVVSTALVGEPQRARHAVNEPVFRRAA